MFLLREMKRGERNGYVPRNMRRPQDRSDSIGTRAAVSAGLRKHRPLSETRVSRLPSLNTSRARDLPGQWLRLQLRLFRSWEWFGSRMNLISGHIGTDDTHARSGWTG